MARAELGGVINVPLMIKSAPLPILTMVPGCRVNVTEGSTVNVCVRMYGLLAAVQLLSVSIVVTVMRVPAVGVTLMVGVMSIQAMAGDGAVAELAGPSGARLTFFGKNESVRWRRAALAALRCTNILARSCSGSGRIRDSNCGRLPISIG